MANGKLIVFEETDGVGKTTLAHALVAALKQRGIAAMYYAFPGREENTLGSLVYRLHHDIQGVVGGPVSPLALQALHIAAHLDAIERVIKPTLEAGTTVVLDRFWWSTQVYSWTSNVPFSILERLIKVEEQCWGDLRPTKLFCILADRPRPSYTGDMEYWRRILMGYRSMIDAHRENPTVAAVGSYGSVESTLSDIMRLLN